MFELENFTCFHTQQFKNIDQLDRTYDVVVAKVSYEFEIDPVTGKLYLSLPKRRLLLHLQIRFTVNHLKLQRSLKATFAFINLKLI